MLGLMRIWFGGKVVSGADLTHDGMGSNPSRYTDCFTGNHFTGRIGPTPSRRRTRPVHGLPCLHRDMHAGVNRNPSLDHGWLVRTEL